ncbi:MAG: glycosyltransferase, partial [Collinsella sp.]|nr:glycosyltransferase [Collinsella sp.]
MVEGSPSYAMRALESIQNQDLYDLQIVVVCRDAAPGVRHSLQVAADRDIHIDLIDVEDAKRGACLRAGFAASRGSQIIAMNADEWFAPQSLSKMVNIACDSTADIVLP